MKKRTKNIWDRFFESFRNRENSCAAPKTSDNIESTIFNSVGSDENHENSSSENFIRNAAPKESPKIQYC